MANTILYGILSQKDLAANYTPLILASEVDQDLLIDSTVEAINAYNASLEDVRSLFCETTTQPIERYRGALTNMLQEGDEFQQPDPVKGANRYSLGFPIYEAKTKWGVTNTAKAKMTLADFAERTEQMLIGDTNWNRYRMFGALLYSGNNGSGAAGTNPFTFSDPLLGDISVYGLANGDNITYTINSSDYGSTDNHYGAQNAAISDAADPFYAILTALAEHADNGNTFISFIPPGLATSVKGLAAFSPDVLTRPAVVAGYKPGVDITIDASVFPGTLPANASIIGLHDGRLFIATWPSIPANTIVSLAYDAPKPLKYRQDPETALQGFKPIDFDSGNFGNRFPYFEEIWQRRGGYAGNNRVGAHVYTIGSSTYAMPTAYAKLYGLA